MKRLFLILAIALFASFTLTSCASSAGSDTGIGTHQAPAITPQGRAAIETARAIGRVALTVTLETRYAVPAEVTTLALAELDASIINPALDGGQFQLVTDEAVWKPVRDDLVKRATALLVKSATSNGVPLLDEATASVLVGQFVDVIAAQVKALSPKKTAQL